MICKCFYNQKHGISWRTEDSVTSHGLWLGILVYGHRTTIAHQLGESIHFRRRGNCIGDSIMPESVQSQATSLTVCLYYQVLYYLSHSSLPRSNTYTCPVAHSVWIDKFHHNLSLILLLYVYSDTLALTISLPLQSNSSSPYPFRSYKS